MTYSETHFTVVFKNLTRDERVELADRYSDKISASSYSHAMDDRDRLLDALAYAEAALGDIGDAGDDLAWCENRAAQALPRVREVLLAHGRKSTSLTGGA